MTPTWGRWLVGSGRRALQRLSAFKCPSTVAPRLDAPTGRDAQRSLAALETGDGRLCGPSRRGSRSIGRRIRTSDDLWTDHRPAQIVTRDAFERWVLRRGAWVGRCR
jgi:hypothetical protein